MDEQCVGSSVFAVLISLSLLVTRSLMSLIAFAFCCLLIAHALVVCCLITGSRSWLDESRLLQQPRLLKQVHTDHSGSILLATTDFHCQRTRHCESNDHSCSVRFGAQSCDSLENSRALT